jgi:hypothetical protein
MAILDKANTSAYGNPEITEVNMGVGSKPGILIIPIKKNNTFLHVKIQILVGGYRHLHVDFSFTGFTHFIDFSFFSAIHISCY